MARVDAYTRELLALAVEAVIEQYQSALGGFNLHPPHPGAGPREREWMVSRGSQDAYGPTLADALAGLLRDLGREVPARPTKADSGDVAVAMVESYIDAIEAQDRGTWTAEAPIEAIFSRLRDLYARDRLAVLALLEDGS